MESVLTTLGYSSREARFLELVVLHSGVFLRRQYLSFIGGRRGKADQGLVSKLLCRRHAWAMPLGEGQTVYHLTYIGFYRALSDETSGFRRRSSELLLKARLMAMDFILAHPGYRYLGTEGEKIAFFTKYFGVEPSILPSAGKRYRTVTEFGSSRHFTEKFPIFVVEAEGQPPEVAFSFIDDGQVTGLAFLSFLDRYRTLMRRIPRLRLYYVSDQATKLAAAERQFTRIIAGKKVMLAADLPEALLRYFEMREIWEGGNQSLSAEEFAELVRLRKLYGGEPYLKIYSEWRQRMAAVTREAAAPGNSSEARFYAFLVPYAYSFLGELRGLRPQAGGRDGSRRLASPAGSPFGSPWRAPYWSGQTTENKDRMASEPGAEGEGRKQ